MHFIVCFTITTLKAGTKINCRQNGNEVKFESRPNWSRQNGSRQNGSRQNGNTRSVNSVRFVNSYGNGLPVGPDSMRFYLTVLSHSVRYGRYVLG